MPKQLKIFAGLIALIKLFSSTQIFAASESISNAPKPTQNDNLQLITMLKAAKRSGVTDDELKQLASLFSPKIEVPGYLQLINMLKIAKKSGITDSELEQLANAISKKIDIQLFFKKNYRRYKIALGISVAVFVAVLLVAVLICIGCFKAVCECKRESNQLYTENSSLKNALTVQRENNLKLVELLQGLIQLRCPSCNISVGDALNSAAAVVVEVHETQTPHPQQMPGDVD